MTWGFVDLKHGRGLCGGGSSSIGRSRCAAIAASRRTAQRSLLNVRAIGTSRTIESIETIGTSGAHHGR